MPKLINRLGELTQSTATAAQTLTLNADQAIEDFATDLATHFANYQLIEVTFANFTDGRGYSTAKLLRDRYGYRGEIRAVGDITVDQLFYLARCGFDSFFLRDDQDPSLAKNALSSFSAGYQKTYPLPAAVTL
jgi:uncharacterized protein (DUF934 family)